MREGNEKKDLDLEKSILTLENMMLLKIIDEEFFHFNNEKDSVMKLPLGGRRSMIDELNREVKIIALARMDSIIAGNSNSVSTNAISLGLMTIYFTLLMNMSNRLAGFLFVATVLLVYMYFMNFKLRLSRKNVRIAAFFKTILEDSISREK